MRNPDNPPISNNNNNNNITKLNQARNYSQGVRNLNLGVFNNNNSNNPPIPNYPSTSTYANVTNNTGNYSLNLNQKLQQDNLAMKKKLKPSLTGISNHQNNNSVNHNNTNYNNNNQNSSKMLINKEFQSEKSFINNQNNNQLNNNTNNQNNNSDNDVYLVDLENSADEYDPNIKKLFKNNINYPLKERKTSAHPINTTGNHINIRDEEKLNSPFKREYYNHKFNSNIKRDESLTKIDQIPYVKKKDLNVFLNEKSKSRPRKVPFK